MYKNKFLWNKKIFLFFWFFLLFGSAIAQSSSPKWVIEASFCNSGIQSNELDLVGKSWTPIPICIQFTNLSPSDISLHIDFLDSSITNDVFKNRACNAADKPKISFGNFMDTYTTTTRIPAWTTSKQEYTITFPVGFSWLSHGCLAYSIVDTMNTSTWGWMANVIIRTVKFIDILVTETQAESKLTLVGSPTLLTNDYKNYFVSYTINNWWNIDEHVSISGTIHSILWYTHDVNFTDSITIAAGETKKIKSNDFFLPRYKWFFVISSILNYIPQLNFNITNNKEIQAISWWNIRDTSIAFIFSRWYAFMLAVVLLLLGILYRFIFTRKNQG